MKRCAHTRLLSQVPSLQPLQTPSNVALCFTTGHDRFLRSCPAKYPSRQVYRKTQHRKAHTRRTISSAALEVDSNNAQPAETSSRPLACLPLSNLVRSYLITSISSIPLLLRPSLAAMSLLAHTKSPLLNPDRNPILHFLLKKTFYVQFCAGETPPEVRRTVTNLKNIGFKGVILGHAKEVVLSKKEAEELESEAPLANQASLDAEEVATWRENTIRTVDLAAEGDFVALKFSGAGRQALRRLKATVACSPEFEEAVHDICRRATERGASLLFDAEQVSLQEGIDNWTIYFARRYNKDKAVVYGTYQSYAKRTPGNLASHLAIARKEGFVLGIKLVRGAYLGSDPRELFWPTIEDTHKCYNNLAKSIIQRRYQGLLEPAGGSTDFPRVSLVLATHNAESVRLARELRDAQARNGEEQIEVAYGQLMGMADNVSCEVVQTATSRLESLDSNTNLEIPKVFKYVVWGQIGECMKYLLRRAQENKDAVTRTVEARRALARELGIRLAFWR